jgi:hypothetical protein
MKKIFLLLLVLAGFTGARAQSMLRVRLADNSQFNVSVDGRYFNKRGTAITVGELPYGSHRVRIFVYTQNRRGRAVEQEIYAGNVTTYRGMISLLVYDPNTHDRDITEQDIEQYTRNHPPVHESDKFSEQYSDNGLNQRERKNGSADDNTNNSFTPPAHPEREAASPLPTEKMGTLKDSKLAGMKTKVTARKTDTEKMNVLKEELSGEKINTYQVGEIMDWFNFESTKVEFAKWAYNITADREYFGDVVGKLTYKNYQDELDQFLKTK